MATPARELRRPVFARFYAWVSPRMEPEAMGDYLRGLAKAAAADASVAITVTAGIAGQLPFPAGSFDVGVVSLMLCSVDDQRAALAELYRVIRPGGQRRFLEHVAAQTPCCGESSGPPTHDLATDRVLVPRRGTRSRRSARRRVRDHDAAPHEVSGQPHPCAGGTSCTWDRQTIHG